MPFFTFADFIMKPIKFSLSLVARVATPSTCNEFHDKLALQTYKVTYIKVLGISAALLASSCFGLEVYRSDSSAKEPKINKLECGVSAKLKYDSSEYEKIIDQCLKSSNP